MLNGEIIPQALALSDPISVDWTGGQIQNNDSAEDIKNVDLTRVHYLWGPIEVEGAMPGDVLCVEILEIQPFPEQQ